MTIFTFFTEYPFNTRKLYINKTFQTAKEKQDKADNAKKNKHATC